MQGISETAIEKRNPTIVTVHRDAMTIEFADKGTFRQAVRTLNDKGVEIYETDKRK